MQTKPIREPEEPEEQGGELDLSKTETGWHTLYPSTFLSTFQYSTNFVFCRIDTIAQPQIHFGARPTPRNTSARHQTTERGPKFVLRCLHLFCCSSRLSTVHLHPQLRQVAVITPPIVFRSARDCAECATKQGADGPSSVVTHFHHPQRANACARELATFLLYPGNVYSYGCGCNLTSTPDSVYGLRH